jgi:tetratricopeptide (TPR) repeat protein
MAFGFGFNKQKVLSAAEKHVQQGRLQNAITEYEKILKNDAKDLTVTNTVGDLYARIGENNKATECFKTVGDAYASQGFTVKAIAMYKKISKLKPSLDSVLKLAELYTQQGLFNDARAQYLQVAEEFLKSGELENAVRIFQKILEMDPENVNMRVRLGEVYIRLGKKAEAWQILSAAVEAMRSKGALAAADEVLQRMLKLDPNSTYALQMQGKILLESGDAEAAIRALQKVSDLDSNPEGLRDLLKAYLQTGRLSDAGALATKLLTVHNDSSAISTFSDALMQAGQYENALQVYDQHSDRMLAENSRKVLENLYAIIGHVRDNPDSLEKLLELFQKAGDTSHLGEVFELLAHASVQSGDLLRARDLYQKLATLEPQNSLHLQNYEQVVSQIGGGSGIRLITPEEAAVIVDELEASVPALPQHYPDEVALAVRSALTDAELFISYNMPAKALSPLLLVLPQAPEDLRLNQRLASLYTRSGRFAEAAVCCRTLQSLYSKADYPDEATRYSELADRYEGRSSAQSPAATVEETAAPLDNIPEAEVLAEESSVQEAAPPEPWPAVAAQPTAEPGEVPLVQEAVEQASVSEESAEAEQSQESADIDLSSEWDDSVTVESYEAPVIEISESKEVPAAAKVQETIDEIRFYLSNGMPEQAWAGLAKLQTQTEDEAQIAAIRAQLEEAAQAAAAQTEGSASSVEEPEIEVVAEEDLKEDESTATEVGGAGEPSVTLPEETPVAAVESVTEGGAQIEPGVLKEFVSDLEASLGGEFLPAEGSKVETVPAPAPQAQPGAAASADTHAVARAQEAVSAQLESAALGEFVADLEPSLGDGSPKAAPAAAFHAPAPLAPPVQPPPPVAEVSALRAASAAAAATASANVPSAILPAPPAVPNTPVFEPPAPLPASVPAKGAKVSPFGEEATVDLAEMFGELKQDLESGAASADEDPETHYNLGIAFREMGLLDEAIGELQKACQSDDRGHTFPQIMQAYTWLAQCFLDKGVPEAAVRWYAKALSVPTIDGETRIALNYELASAYESAGDKPSALKHFMDVYGSNIDYRDVAERIKALKS